MSKDNLIKGKDAASIYVTGTAIDALKTTVRVDYTHEQLEWPQIADYYDNCT